MTKVIINDRQRGLLFKNGKYVKMLSSGKYYTGKDKLIEILSVDSPVCSENCPLEILLEDKELSSAVSYVEVPDEHIALHFVGGIFRGVLRRGRYAYWNICEPHEYKLVDISDPMLNTKVPEYVFARLSTLHCNKVEVAEYEKARLFYNNKFMCILDAGTYYFWADGTDVRVDSVDTRITQLNIGGQEMLTQDKVTLRVNFVLNYRVRDFVRILTEIDNFKEQLHVAAQLALREYVGRHRLDEILDNKDEMSAFVLGRLKEKENTLFVEILDAGVKDIILPGEVRDIMNTVLIAEKRAQASVITRREEVASTRSLLNTAKLMDENRTLYRLKELEYIERICENVGNINLGSGDMLTQLAGIIGSP